MLNNNQKLKQGIYAINCSRYTFFTKLLVALTGVARWVRRHPAKGKVADLIPGQGTSLGCGPGPC